MSQAPAPDGVSPEAAPKKANGSGDGLSGFLLRILPILLLTPAAVQVISILQMICTQYVNIPNWDDWDLYPILADWRDGRLNLPDLFAIHNGHRIVFTRLIFVANEALFHGTRLPILLLSFLVQIVTLATLSLAILRLRMKPIPSATAVAVTAFLLFSLTASETWLWGFLIQHTLALMFFCLAVFALPRAPSGAAAGRTVAACFLGACATYTSGNAIIALPAVLALSLAYRLPARFSWGIFAASVLAIGPYFAGYHGDSSTPNRAVTIADRLQYVFAFLGGPFGQYDVAKAAIMGVIVFAGLIVCVSLAVARRRRNGDTRLFPWLALALLPLFTAAGGAADRIAFGVDQSLSSRYMTTSVLTWIAVAVSALYLLSTRPVGAVEPKAPPVPSLRPVSYAAVAAALCVLAYLHQITGNHYFHDLSAFGDQRAAAADALRKGDRSDAVLLTLYPDRDRLLYLISQYQEKRLFPFEQP